MNIQSVNVDNFARAETSLMFTRLAASAGGAGKWHHYREPSRLDNQPVIRQNRDTLYSTTLVDISAGAILTVPDAGSRYLSVMVINEDHYINKVIHSAGEHELTVAQFDTPFVLVAARTFIDPADPADVALANDLQDKFAIRSTSNSPYVAPGFDEKSLTATRDSLLDLARGLGGFGQSFGAKQDVNPIHHLIATAAGWGGLPSSEAFYQNVDPGLPVGEYKIEIGDVPVDAFWSITLYNREGFMEPNKRNFVSVNSVTASRNADNSVTVNFGAGDLDKPNYFPIMDGWNFIVRMYKPHPEIVDGTWTFPELQPA